VDKKSRIKWSGFFCVFFFLEEVPDNHKGYDGDQNSQPIAGPPAAGITFISIVAFKIADLHKISPFTYDG
jgi:hypothetical protein